MHTSWIEELVVTEFRNLCAMCTHADNCEKLRKLQGKMIIQCESFENDNTGSAQDNAMGLCRSCDRAAHCTLPERSTGTWHCKKFE